MIKTDSTRDDREVSLDFTAVRILCFGKRPWTDACFSERSLRHSPAGHPASRPEDRHGHPAGSRITNVSSHRVLMDPQRLKRFAEYDPTKGGQSCRSHQGLRGSRLSWRPRGICDPHAVRGWTPTRQLDRVHKSLDEVVARVPARTERSSGPGGIRTCYAMDSKPAVKCVSV